MIETVNDVFGIDRQVGRNAEARIAYDEALILTDNEVERDFLASRIRSLDER